MTDSRVVDQVYGILSREELAFATHPDRPSFMVPYESTAVYIDFYDQRGSTVVGLRAYVLQDVDLSGENFAKALITLNQLNAQNFFGKLWLDPDDRDVVLEYEILGDHLQPQELMGALSHIAVMADDLDDQLRGHLGSGQRARDIWERDAGGGSGPVVSA